MKIVCVGYLEGSGGAERQITLLANELANLGNEVYLAVVAKYNKKYDISDNVIVKDLTCFENSKLSLVSRYLALKKLYTEIKPDVTVHFWFQSLYLSTFMKKKYRNITIYSERGDPGDSEYNGLLGIVRSVAFKQVNGFVFQSNGAKSYFQNQIRERSIVIPNPVFIKRSDFPVIKCRTKRIVTMGRLHPQKNQKLLIEAFAIIHEEFPDYIVEIYGDGPLEAELHQLIKNKNLEDRIFLMGARKDVHNAIVDASLFVLTSDYEGLPNALIEAMALGIPSISTDCKPGGAREIITDKIDGFIVPRNDAYKLANTMRNILNDQNLANRISKNAEINIKRFNKNTIYNRWNTFIHDVVENKYAAKK